MSFIGEIVKRKKINLKHITKDFLSYIMNIKYFKNTSQLKIPRVGVYLFYVITMKINNK